MMMCNQFITDHHEEHCCRFVVVVVLSNGVLQPEKTNQISIGGRKIRVVLIAETLYQLRQAHVASRE